ncbi:UDP-glucose 4-epimerase [Aliiroseovarius halocynthiae]|uniref:SDR family oxidoreductase n=1 Tax=Aliiroseovarius halocynthiae TaxID=985055 RepID=A0A545SU27_9RHOB|nr:SDR family oxidoreductase [Aliiroseovarius halocynthiae]TQV68466.1 SDR family oxidoreductase [Aliiroseovarius halocynthiae]SMR70863.1 UDP-glucose 4-epimerase [Aliiroseovarius halocynthiae]
MTKILITGAAGAVGRALLQRLGRLSQIDVIATDICTPPELPENARFLPIDVTKDDAQRIIMAERPETIVHLASIVTPGAGSTRDLEYQVDVGGTRRVLDAAIAAGVRRLVVTSSGAAYGYHADNSVPLCETDPIRGNKEFAYSWHKRLVEEMLAKAREGNPDLEQVVLRVGTVLGVGVDNQITALFHKPRLLGLIGSDSPFVFIWDEDLAEILLRAATDSPAGIFNVSGDGALTVSQIAEAMGKPVRWLPPRLVRLALSIAHPLSLSRYGPEQVRFLQFRPVLGNSALKKAFGYQPRYSSAEAFQLWWRAQDD